MITDLLNNLNFNETFVTGNFGCNKRLVMEAITQEILGETC